MLSDSFKKTWIEGYENHVFEVHSQRMTEGGITLGDDDERKTDSPKSYLTIFQ